MHTTNQPPTKRTATLSIAIDLTRPHLADRRRARRQRRNDRATA